MPKIHSQIKATDAAFQDNAAAMQQLVDELHQRQQKTRLGGPERSRKKHQDRGKLLVRERIRTLLDDGSPFL